MNKQDLLLSLYITSIVASELMGAKTFTLFGISASVAIFTLPLTFSVNDVVTEVYGKKRAVSFVKSGFVVLIFLLLFNLLALWLPASARFQASEPAYELIFAKSLRITVASLIAFWLGERFDVFVFSKIREKLGKRRLWLRNNVSNFIGQLFDTGIFMFLAFYEPGAFGFVLSLIWPYWLLKCAFSIAETPLTYLGVRWLGKNKSDIVD
jgi:queuosine precursor transporter